MLPLSMCFLQDLGGHFHSKFGENLLNPADLGLEEVGTALYSAVYHNYGSSVGT